MVSGSGCSPKMETLNPSYAQDTRCEEPGGSFWASRKAWAALSVPEHENLWDKKVLPRHGELLEMGCLKHRNDSRQTEKVCASRSSLVSILVRDQDDCRLTWPPSRHLIGRSQIASVNSREQECFRLLGVSSFVRVVRWVR